MFLILLVLFFSVSIPSRLLSRRRKIFSHQPFVEFLWVVYVILVWYDGVDELLSMLYTLAAFLGQEAPLSWTVDAYLTILA